MVAMVMLKGCGVCLDGNGKAACAFHPVAPQNASFMVLGSIPPVLCPQ